MLLNFSPVYYIIRNVYIFSFLSSWSTGVTNSHGDQLALLSHHGFESRRSNLNFIQAFFFLFFRTTSLHNFDDLSSAESFCLLMRRSILL